MMGPMQVVGNAQVFVVVHDMQTDKEYGMRFEVSDPSIELFNYGATGPITLNGEVISREIINLDSYETMNKEKALKWK
ncbi:MAG: hypothetical protein J5965_10270 [Aeriscardovia sp.]|nr:hypothetical protein [Aeriscardovia sp.]